jgi:hypothetical protein
MRSVVSLFSGEEQTENTCIPVRDILHGTFLCSALARHRVRTLRHRDTRVTYSEHVKLTIRRLDAYIVGYETSVYTSTGVANRIAAKYISI